MNTFLPYPSFKDSAKCLDNKRLGKQRVECLQILRTLEIGPYQIRQRDSEDNMITWASCDEMEYDHIMSLSNLTFEVRKTPWYNHPVVKLWRGYRGQLSIYSFAIVNEWNRRGFKDTIASKLTEHHIKYLIEDLCNAEEYRNLSWLTPEFCLSHQSNLIRKNPSFYRPIFGEDVPDNLPYIWPVK